MEKSEILNLDTRRRIYNYVKSNPGLHIRELSRRLRISYNNIDYHLNYLKKLGLINVKPDNSYFRAYVTNSIGINQKIILNLIRQRTPRHILIFMCTWAITSQNELSKHLDKHPTTISFHLKKLLKFGIIEPAPTVDGVTLTNHPSGRNVDRFPVTNETLYRINNYDLIKKMFVTHKKSLFKDKYFKFAFNYVNWASAQYKEEKKNKNIKTYDWYLDLVLEAFLDACPHPYHVGSGFL